MVWLCRRILGEVKVIEKTGEEGRSYLGAKLVQGKSEAQVKETLKMLSMRQELYCESMQK
jgi:hypothetical protein